MKMYVKSHQSVYTYVFVMIDILRDYDIYQSKTTQLKTDNTTSIVFFRLSTSPPSFHTSC